MKRILMATAALALPLGFSACSTAGLSDTEEAVESYNENMSMAMKEEIGELNKLTRIYIDAAALYKQAADIPDETNGLKPALLELAKEKNAQLDLLQEQVLSLGGEPAERGQALGTAHRGFTSLRTMVDNDSEVAVEEVLRGERYILEEINKALPKTMTPTSRTLLAQLRTDAETQISRLEAVDKEI